MTKLKGRLSLKQYTPLKPTKREIKLWILCDAETGYVYDTNKFREKEFQLVKGTLGKRVVKKIVEFVRSDVVLILLL